MFTWPTSRKPGSKLDMYSFSPLLPRRQGRQDHLLWQDPDLTFDPTSFAGGGGFPAPPDFDLGDRGDRGDDGDEATLAGGSGGTRSSTGGLGTGSSSGLWSLISGDMRDAGELSVGGISTSSCSGLAADVLRD